MVIMKEIIFAAVGVPLLAVLLSLDAVDQNEYGLKYNWVTKTLHKDVYHGGTHFIGFWNKFIVFPATVQTIEFSDRIGKSSAPMLKTRTKEGLALQLSISFQYKLEQDRLMDLFALTNTNYEGLFRRIARDQLLEAASEYEGPQYWMERQKIGDHMRRLVDEQLKESCASLWGLQLQVIDLPDRYEKSITITQVQQQIIKTRRNEQVAASIRADTDVLQADFARQIQIVQAGAQANFSMETKVAEAEATKRKIGAEADAVGYVRERLGLSPADAVRYAQLLAYSQLDNATILADLAGPAKAGLAASAASASLSASAAASSPPAAAAAAATAATAAAAAAAAPASALQEARRSAVGSEAPPAAAATDSAPSDALSKPSLRAGGRRNAELRQQMMSLFRDAPAPPSAS